MPQFSDAALVVLAQLPSHPVFLTDLNAGVVALGLRFDTRDQSDRQLNRDYGFPGRDNAEQIKTVLALVQTRLGCLVDVAPLVAVLDRATDGPLHGERDTHRQLECLAALGCDPRHVIVKESEHDDVAIARFLAAAHLALFGTLPVHVQGKIVGCTDCAFYRTRDGQPMLDGSRPFTGSVIGSANADGHLAPGVHVPSQTERDAACMERGSIFRGIHAHATIRLALRALAVARDLTADDVRGAAGFDPDLVLNAQALGIVTRPDYELVVAG